MVYFILMVYQNSPFVFPHYKHHAGFEWHVGEKIMTDFPFWMNSSFTCRPESGGRVEDSEGRVYVSEYWRRISSEGRARISRSRERVLPLLLHPTSPFPFHDLFCRKGHHNRAGPDFICSLNNHIYLRRTWSLPAVWIGLALIREITCVFVIVLLFAWMCVQTGIICDSVWPLICLPWLLTSILCLCC